MPMPNKTWLFIAFVCIPMRPLIFITWLLSTFGSPVIKSNVQGDPFCSFNSHNTQGFLFRFQINIRFKRNIRFTNLHPYSVCIFFTIYIDTNLLLTEREGQYSPVRLEVAWLVSSFLYGTRAMLVLNLPAFENKKIHSRWLFPWKRSVWQNPDQERTNHNAPIFLAI